MRIYGANNEELSKADMIIRFAMSQTDLDTSQIESIREMLKSGKCDFKEFEDRVSRLTRQQIESKIKAQVEHYVSEALPKALEYLNKK